MRIDDGGSAVYTLPPPPPPPKQNTSPSVDVATAAHTTSATTMTPQQRVDAAVAKYGAAVKGGDKTAIAQAQQEVYAAVRGEIGPQQGCAPGARRGTVKNRPIPRHHRDGA